ncbi:predicted protein [Sparassis crispa]|uniref:Rho-GAP domain-containing protein n=1 Tax=Sparassis crispa TaxID=139825 RepID=A0A401GFH5_9APHY|nr:predicted protein [Sparassis crispa]GBE80922.1 predicted protein [Sparassis crispa]
MTMSRLLALISIRTVLYALPTLTPLRESSQSKNTTPVQVSGTALAFCSMPLFTRHTKRPPSPEPELAVPHSRVRSPSVSHKSSDPAKPHGYSKGGLQRDAQYSQGGVVRQPSEPHRDPRSEAHFSAHPSAKPMLRQPSRRGSTGQERRERQRAHAVSIALDRAPSVSDPRDATTGLRDYALVGDESQLSPVHSSVRSIRTIDTEPDRLARTCGQGPISMRTARPRPLSSTTTPRMPSAAREAQYIAQPTLGEDEDIGKYALSSGGQVCSLRARRSPSSHAHSFVPSSSLVPMTLPYKQQPDEDDHESPALFRTPEPRPVLKSLSKLLQRQGQRLQDYIEVEELLEDKEREEKDRQAIARRLQSLLLDGPQNGDGKDTKFRVFGASLREAATYAPTTAVLCGYQHNLPTVVYACIEELYRTGIYQQGLFRALPNRARLFKLVGSFNTAPPPFSPAPYELPTVRQESMPNICALLSTYLDALPDALLNRTFHNALWSWCIRPSVAREEEQRAREMSPEQDGDSYSRSKRRRKRSQSDPFVKGSPSARDMTQEELRQQELDAEAPQIAIAQHIFRLLPRENFSLLFYLCAFFTQIPLCPDNGIVFEDVARIFGHRLLGGPSKNAARLMMVWLLNRWGRISEGFFDAEQEAVSKRGSRKSTVQVGAPDFNAEERNRRASYPTRMADSSRVHLTYIDQCDTYTEFERAVHSQMQDHLGLPARRPYSSFSSDASSSTFTSTTDSELSDFSGQPISRSSLVPRTEGDDQNQRVSSGKEPYAPNNVAIVRTQDYVTFPGHPPGDREVIESPYPDADRHGTSPSDTMYQMSRVESAADSASIYSAGEDDATSCDETESRSHESDEQFSPLHRVERHPPNLSSRLADSTFLPTDLSTSNRELSSARDRIAQLERALELAGARTLDGGPADAERTPRQQTRYQSDQTRNDTASAVHSETRRQLQVALSQRDDARKLMLNFKKVIEGALEK